MSQKYKIEIFVDPNRAGHDKSVEKKISVLAQIFTKLWSIYELHNYIILIIILKIVFSLDFLYKLYRMMQNNIY